MKEIGIMEVGGFSVGHAQDIDAATGCTVILFDRMSPASLDVRGGGPASRESQILMPLAAAQGINAVLLSGGSAYGLDAAGGVMRWLEERGIGYAVGPHVVPLVSQSDVFDLGVGQSDVRPDAGMAYAACEAASHDAPQEGNVGVGTGCSVGKLFGPSRAMKAGFGTYAMQCGRVKVGALVAVNAFGSVLDGAGSPVAGLLNAEGNGLVNMVHALLEAASQPQEAFVSNTTIGLIVTNVRLQKAELTKVAGMAHDGYARAINPVHTSRDGDSIYAASTGEENAPVDLVGIMAAEVMQRAIVRAAKASQGAYGLKAWEDLQNP